MNRSILRRRSRRKISRNFELPLTSMMDMLIIMLVFLLKSYSTSAVSFTISENIALPQSTVTDEPATGVNLMVEPAHFEDQNGKTTLVRGGIIVEGTKVVEFTDEPVPVPIDDGHGGKQTGVAPGSLKYELEPRLLGDGGLRILPLFDALVKEKEKAEYIQSTQTFEKTEINKEGVAEKVVVPPPKFNGTLFLHADKAVEYDLLRKIMYTAATAEFKTFKLVAAKKEDLGTMPAAGPSAGH